MVQIVCGDPRLKPATSTRFVLPFAYALGDSRSYQADSMVYRRVRDDPNLAWRVRYLTDETSEVLFRRAKWFEVPDDLWNGISTSFRTRFADSSVLLIEVAPPTIVLFEFAHSQAPAKGKLKSDLLQIGLLIVETYFSDSAKSGLHKPRQPQLDDLLLLNEVVRYWRRPFDGHEKDKYGSVLAEWPVSIIDAKGPKISHPERLDPYLDRWATFLDIPIEEEGVCRRVIPEDWQDRAHDRNRTGRKLGVDTWDVYSDCRTFVWTCAIVEKGGE